MSKRLDGRIATTLPEIREIVGNDCRDAVIEYIGEIVSAADALTPHKERATLARAIGHLIKARKLMVEAGREELLPEIDLLLQDLPTATPLAVMFDPKLTAAQWACDLMYHFSSMAPTLTRDGPYLRLAGLLYYAATGQRADLERACKQNFDELKQNGSDLYTSRRGPRPPVETSSS